MSRSDRQQLSSGSSEAADQLALGREAYERRAWADAHRFLSRAGEEVALPVDDLERLAMSAYLAGRDEEYRVVFCCDSSEQQKASLSSTRRWSRSRPASCRHSSPA